MKLLLILLALSACSSCPSPPSIPVKHWTAAEQSQAAREVNALDILSNPESTADERYAVLPVFWGDDILIPMIEDYARLRIEVRP